MKKCSYLKQFRIPMVFLFFLTLLVPVVLPNVTWTASAASQNNIRIACIGDSITYGTLVKNRSQNCYPSQLSRLLGHEFTVKNYGVNGYTMLKKSDCSYWTHEYYKESTAFNPDIILLMLGTNDSKTYNWNGIDQYLCDYRDMIRHYQSLPSSPRIYLMTSPPAYLLPGETQVKCSIQDDIITEISSALKTLAQEEHLSLIDLNSALKEHPEYFEEDGIHPNAAGATQIARLIHKRLMEDGV